LFKNSCALLSINSVKIFSGDDGVILLDTTGSKFAMEKVWEKVREKIPSKPLKAIVITHFHKGVHGIWEVRNVNKSC